MQCEAGAFFDERAKVNYLCPYAAEVEVRSGEAVLIVYCGLHAREFGADWIRRPGIALRQAFQ